MKEKQFIDSLKHYKELSDIGTKLRDARIKAGLTQTQVAKKMGSRQQLIAQIESGKSSPSIKTLIRFAEALSKKIDIKIADGEIITKKKDLEGINIKTYLQVFWHDIALKMKSTQEIDKFLNINEIIHHFIDRGEENLNKLFNDETIKQLSQNKEILFFSSSLMYLTGACDAFGFLWAALQIKNYIPRQ